MSKDAFKPEAPKAPETKPVEAAPVVVKPVAAPKSKGGTYLVKRKAFWLGRLYAAGETIELKAGDPVSSAFEAIDPGATPAPAPAPKPLSGRPSDKDVA